MTSTDRRAALRAGAGLVAGGAFAGACAPSGTTARHAPVAADPPPGSAPATGPAAPHGSASATGPAAPHGSASATEPAVPRGSASATAPAAPHGSGPATAPATPHRAAPAPRAFPGRHVQISSGPRDRPRVALTFHGQGEPALARALLGEAERHGARVTVLAVGTWLDEHPELARRILDGGHDLGNHTQRHLDINAMAQPQARAEIAGCAERLRRLTGSVGTWFRPSRTARASPLVERLARAAGYPHVLSYDVDSLDFTSPGAPAVTANVLREVRAGSVVSMHFGYADTVAALPAVLDELDRRGLRAVTTTELLS